MTQVENDKQIRNMDDVFNCHSMQFCQTTSSTITITMALPGLWNYNVTFTLHETWLRPTSHIQMLLTNSCTICNLDVFHVSLFQGALMGWFGCSDNKLKIQHWTNDLFKSVWQHHIHLGMIFFSLLMQLQACLMWVEFVGCKKKTKEIKIGYKSHLHATWQGSVIEVRTPGAPDPVVRDRHPAIVTFTHKQRIFHLLTRAIIIRKCPSTASTDGKS